MHVQVPGEPRARRLEEGVREILRRVEGVDQAALYQAPGQDDWSAMKILAHLAEMLPYWARQASEVAARERDNEPYGRTHDDPERIGAVERHANDTLETTLQRLRDGLAEAATTI